MIGRRFANLPGASSDLRSTWCLLTPEFPAGGFLTPGSSPVRASRKPHHISTLSDSGLDSECPRPAEPSPHARQHQRGPPGPRVPRPHLSASVCPCVLPGLRSFWPFSPCPCTAHPSRRPSCPLSLPPFSCLLSSSIKSANLPFSSLFPSAGPAWRIAILFSR